MAADCIGRVRTSLMRSWIFIRMIKGKRREMGLGSFLDISLAQAREKASSVRAGFLEGPNAQPLRTETPPPSPLGSLPMR